MRLAWPAALAASPQDCVEPTMHPLALPAEEGKVNREEIVTRDQPMRTWSRVSEGAMIE